MTFQCEQKYHEVRDAVDVALGPDFDFETCSQLAVHSAIR